MNTEEAAMEEFGEEDCNELEDLYRAVWPTATEYPEHWRQNRMMSSDQVREEMRQGIRFFGVRGEGKIVGVYKARITEDECFGEHQSILASHRGSGVATLMYDQFKKLAKDNGCRVNSVNVLLGQEPTLRLVENHGFHKVGEPFEQSPGMFVQRFERNVD